MGGMIRHPHRAKGAAALGANQPGLFGPFGRRPDPDDHDDGQADEDGEGSELVPTPDTPTVDAVVDDRVQQQLDAARARQNRRREQRQEFDRRRHHGLAQRHVRKLQALADRDQADQPDRRQTAPPPTRRNPAMLLAICPACRTQRLHTTLGHAQVNGERLHILRCNSCRLAWSPTPPPAPVPAAVPA